MTPLTPARCARIRALRADGLMVSEIADRIKLPVSRVQQVVDRLPRRLRYASADLVGGTPGSTFRLQVGEWPS